jgi:hypothetical protein
MQIHQSGCDYPYSAGLDLSPVDTIEAFRVSLHTPDQFRQTLDALDPFTGRFAIPVWEMNERQEIDPAA